MGTLLEQQQREGAARARARPALLATSEDSSQACATAFCSQANPLHPPLAPFSVNSSPSLRPEHLFPGPGSSGDSSLSLAPDLEAAAAVALAEMMTSFLGNPPSRAVQAAAAAAAPPGVGGSGSPPHQPSVPATAPGAAAPLGQAAASVHPPSAVNSGLLWPTLLRARAKQRGKRARAAARGPAAVALGAPAASNVANRTASDASLSFQVCGMGRYLPGVGDATINCCQGIKLVIVIPAI